MQTVPDDVWMDGPEFCSWTRQPASTAQPANNFLLRRQNTKDILLIIQKGLKPVYKAAFERQSLFTEALFIGKSLIVDFF